MWPTSVCGVENSLTLIHTGTNVSVGVLCVQIVDNTSPDVSFYSPPGDVAFKNIAVALW